MTNVLEEYLSNCFSSLACCIIYIILHLQATVPLWKLDTSEEKDFQLLQSALSRPLPSEQS